MEYIYEDELIQFLNQDNGTLAMSSSYRNECVTEVGQRATVAENL